MEAGIRKLLLTSIPLVVGACAHAEVSMPSPNSTFQAEFPATWMEQMIFAYEDFKATHEDLSCFKVWTYQDDELFYIRFAPSKGVEVEGDSIKIPIAGQTSCGRGTTYEFDRNGKFVQRTGMR